MKPTRLLVLPVAGILLVTACAGDSDAEARTTTTLLPTSTSAAAITTEAPVAQPASTATDAIDTVELPIAYGPAVLVAGKEDCDLDDIHAPWSTDPDGTWLIRDGWFECVVANNDPRIAGTAHYTLNMNQWAPSDEHLAQVMWGTIFIENEGGGWEADYVGVFTMALGDVFTALFTGTGDYEGLSYYQWAVETQGFSWPTKGLIFPSVSSMP